MGKSPAIRDLEARDPVFGNYLNNLQTQLNGQVDDLDGQLQHRFSYWKPAVPDAKVIVSGCHLDFEYPFSLDNLEVVLNAIAGAVLSGSPVPAGAKIETSAQQEAVQALSSYAADPAVVQLYVAGNAFAELGSIVYDLPSFDDGFTRGFAVKPLGLGLQLFAGVATQTFNVRSFFDNENLYGYLYSYQVYFSPAQLKDEIDRTIAQHLYRQVAIFEMKMRKLPIPEDEPSGEARRRYQALVAGYERHIAAGQAELTKLDYPPSG